MYKIFFNDRVLSICNDWDTCSGINATIYKVTKKSEIKPIVEHFRQNSAMQELWLYTEDPEAAMEEVVTMFTVMEAAGGLVGNARDEYLLIYRNGRWDLPKGKHEEGETMPETALREVTEECGIKELALLDFIAHTYHTYVMNSTLMLKRTHWYSMRYTGSATPVPQAEEGIKEVRWVPRGELLNYLPEMYPSIAELVAGYFR